LSNREDQVRWADVSVLRPGTDAGVAVAAPPKPETMIRPVECILPLPQERRETFLVIRDVQTMEVVTIIETLSPANKRTGSDGRAQYLAKREEILTSKTNLIELDLLRGGKRLPVVGMPAGDYYAVVSRGYRRPRADVYSWTLQQPLPPIPIPLKQGEAEAEIDLQQVFTTVFDRARYHLSLDYGTALNFPLSEVQGAWMKQLIDNRRSS